MSNPVCLRFELYQGGLSCKWRPLVNLEHGTLCRQAGLDPVRFYFDVPESARGMAKGGARFNGRKIDGFIMDAATREPVGKITFAYEGEKFRDEDPRDTRDWQRLG